MHKQCCIFFIHGRTSVEGTKNRSFITGYGLLLVNEIYFKKQNKKITENIDLTGQLGIFLSYMYFMKNYADPEY